MLLSKEFVPIRTPFLSNNSFETNGYVATSPEVKTFLEVISFISSSKSLKGIMVFKACSCLKFALIVVSPHETATLSILSTSVSNSSLDLAYLPI